jgi:hypothetical protein
MGRARAEFESAEPMQPLASGMRTVTGAVLGNNARFACRNSLEAAFYPGRCSP